MKSTGNTDACAPQGLADLWEMMEVEMVQKGGTKQELACMRNVFFCGAMAVLTAGLRGQPTPGELLARMVTMQFDAMEAVGL
jgi:hypothetical protein